MSEVANINGGVSVGEDETDEQKKERAVQCGKEIEAAVNKWNCRIEVGMKLFEGRNEPLINIVPK